MEMNIPASPFRQTGRVYTSDRVMGVLQVVDTTKFSVIDTLRYLDGHGILAYRTSVAVNPTKMGTSTWDM